VCLSLNNGCYGTRFSIATVYSPDIHGAAKSGPLKFFAVFSATVWDFNMKFYGFIYGNLLHLIVK